MKIGERAKFTTAGLAQWDAKRRTKVVGAETLRHSVWREPSI